MAAGIRVLGLGLLLTTLALATSATAFVSVVPMGDPLVGETIVERALSFTYYDANANGVVDAQQPDEPLYLHIGPGIELDYGDIRLSDWRDYEAGTAVDGTNIDIERALTNPPGWFATSAEGTWYADVDASNTVSVGDVRFGGASGAIKVTPGDSSMGHGLTAFQLGVQVTVRGGYVDSDRDGRLDAGEPIILQRSRTGRVEPTDVRLLTTGYSTDAATPSGDSHSHPEIEGNYDDLAAKVDALGDRVDLLVDRVATLERDLGDDQEGAVGGGNDSGLIGGAALVALIGLAALAQAERGRRARSR